MSDFKIIFITILITYLALYFSMEALKPSDEWMNNATTLQKHEAMK